MENESSQPEDRYTVSSPTKTNRILVSENAVEDINHARRKSIKSNGSAPVSPEGQAKNIFNRTLSIETLPKKEVKTPPPSKSCAAGRFLTKISSLIIVGLEKSFFRIGFFVGMYPILTIVICLSLCGLTGLGMKTFTGNTEDDTVWVPRGARLLDEKKWVEANFPDETRFVMFLIENRGNVLTPAVINAMMDYYEESLNINAWGKRFSQICVRTGDFCAVTSLLELWNFNSTVIRGLTTDDIIRAINETEVTPLSGVEVETLLGGTITRNASSVILSAEATQITWVTTKEFEGSSKAFEKSMINRALRGHSDIQHTYVYASRSFDDEGYGAINSDVNLLTTGFIIVFVYILFALGKFNLMEQKIYLSLCGMVCVGFAVLAALGIGTALSVVYSPIQSILPFLLLGIGVDDMFVIVESWKNLRPEDRDLDVPNKIAKCLGHAGVSITVTSVTDVVAFGIGASTVIPALSSFCIYATIGIFALFFLVSTLFVAVLALDERRRKANRDGCIVCYRHSDTYQPNRWSTGQSLLQRIFTNYYGPLITKKPIKVVIMVLSVVMVSIGMWRFALMEEDFDVVNYIPSDSYAYEYSRIKEYYFNRQGIATRVYCGAFNYLAYQNNLDSMRDNMAGSAYIQQGTINAWFTAFHDYLVTSGITVASEDSYYQELYQYLQTPEGSRYDSFIKWNSSSVPVSIVASYITANHKREDDSQGNIRSMDSLRAIIDSSGFPKYNQGGMPEYKCFCYAREYMSLETNKVLQEELYRNLALAAVAVLIVTIVLVSNFRTSLMVFICVFFTVIDVGGVLELWGTTIDTASSVLLTLAVGLAVDYSVHIGHTFMTVEGTRHERTVLTLQHIGPAVLNGGLSTFLAFVLLANSASYGFQLFFRVFMSVVIFGMFHGLCLLPVLLSLMGPPSYKHSQESPQEPKEVPPENHVAQVIHSESQSRVGTTCKERDSSIEMPQVVYDGPYTELNRIVDEDITPADHDQRNGHILERSTVMDNSDGHFHIDHSDTYDDPNGHVPQGSTAMDNSDGRSQNDCSDVHSHNDPSAGSSKHVSVVRINGALSGNKGGGSLEENMSPGGH